MPPDAPVAFACMGCGDCCRWPGHVLLTDADIVRLAAALRLDERAFVETPRKQEGRRGEVRTSCPLPYFDFPGRGAVRVPGHPRRMWSFRSGTGSAPGIPCGGRCRS